jgi:hypothetical protein
MYLLERQIINHITRHPILPFHNAITMRFCTLFCNKKGKNKIDPYRIDK